MSPPYEPKPSEFPHDRYNTTRPTRTAPVVPPFVYEATSARCDDDHWKKLLKENYDAHEEHLLASEQRLQNAINECRWFKAAWQSSQEANVELEKKISGLEGSNKSNRPNNYNYSQEAKKESSELLEVKKKNEELKSLVQQLTQRVTLLSNFISANTSAETGIATFPKK